jgi:hypothetical protein
MTTMNQFSSCTLSEKFYFFENELMDYINLSSNRAICSFFEKIIKDISENGNLRCLALRTLTECVFLGKVKTRQALSLLVDTWTESDDLFLRIQRLKDLYYFYHEEESGIESIYRSCLDDDECDVVSESLLNLGLIALQKGFLSCDKNEAQRFFMESKSFLVKSTEIAENRTDAIFYMYVVSILIDLLNGVSSNRCSDLKRIANILFNREIYSSSFSINQFYIGFYRILNSLNLLTNENPDTWLEYRNGFSRLFVQFSEINSQNIKDRLNQSVLSELFLSMVKHQFIEPYFSLNFSAQLSKLDERIRELDPNSKELDFLKYIKAIASNKTAKKKHNKELILADLITIFPTRNKLNIEESLDKIEDFGNAHALLNVVFELQTPSISSLTDKIVLSCIALQGNRLYRGNFSEDDRNTFITSHLDASGYNVKDQTRWSSSVAGKSAGELDIFVKDNKGLPLAIIEALNLEYLNREYIDIHIDKIFNYDATGIESNFIIIYSNSQNFENLWVKYVHHISNHIYKFELLKIQEINDYPYTDIRLCAAMHQRNNRQIILFHLMVNLAN